MDNNNNEINVENVPEPKIEKISLSAIKDEIKKQKEDEYKKGFKTRFDSFLDAYNKLTPEEKEQFFSLGNDEDEDE